MQPDSLAVAQQNLLDQEPVQKTLSIWELINSGGIGGQIIITTLAVLLFAALYLYFERIMAINKASKIDSSFMNNIKMNIMGGKLDAAKMLCAQTNSPVARLIEKGISRIGKPLEDINTAIDTCADAGVASTIARFKPVLTIKGYFLVAFYVMLSHLN